MDKEKRASKVDSSQAVWWKSLTFFTVAFETHWTLAPKDHFHSQLDNARYLMLRFWPFPVLLILFIKVRNRESIKCYLQMSPKCCLPQRPSITWHRGSYFQRFQLTYQELWESASAKTTTFILRSCSSQLYGDPIRGQVCVHYRCSSINAQDGNLV